MNRNSNLILHCGARRIDRDRLSKIPCPRATETWHPIPHIELIQQIERALTTTNMAIVNEAYGVSADNAKMFGLLQVARENQTGADYAYVIGVRGALDKSLSRGVAVGSSVFVCDNLAFSSEIVFHRKQTKFIMDDLPAMVDTAIGQLGQHWVNQETRIDTYKKTSIADKDAAYLLMEMAGDVFPEQKVTDIYAEFKKPRHEEFGRENVWAFFNAVTEYLKPRGGATSKASGLWTMPARTGRLHKVCDDYSGLEINTRITAVQVQPEPVLGVGVMPAVAH